MTEQFFIGHNLKTLCLIKGNYHGQNIYKCTNASYQSTSVGQFTSSLRGLQSAQLTSFLNALTSVDCSLSRINLMNSAFIFYQRCFRVLFPRTIRDSGNDKMQRELNIEPKTEPKQKLNESQIKPKQNFLERKQNRVIQK